MQFDMFGASAESAIREAAPPVLSASGAWMPPEAVAFNTALRSGSMFDAVAVLKTLKTPVMVSVLLASGFLISEQKDRNKVIASVQSDIVAAVRLRMTGHELWASREAGQSEKVNSPDAPIDIRVGDLLRKDGLNYVVSGPVKGGVAATHDVLLGDGVVQTTTIFLLGDAAIAAWKEFDEFANFPSFMRKDAEPVIEAGAAVTTGTDVAVEAAVAKERITQAVAGNMRAGMRVVDGVGKEYQAFSARFNYLEVHPIGANGKPEVWAGNSVFFHLDPATAVLFPNRRHDPIFLGNEIALDNTLNTEQNTSINNATIARGEKEKKNGPSSTGEPGSLRTGDFAGDRAAGEPGVVDSESVVSGLAGSGVGAAQGGDVHRLPEGTSGDGVERDSRGRVGEPTLGEPRVDANVRSATVSASADNDDLNAGSARKLTRDELNALLVTEMTDDQLLQAKTVFAGGRRSDSIDRQIAIRAAAAKPVEKYRVTKGEDGQFTLENDESILAGNGDGSPRKFTSSLAAANFAVENGFEITKLKDADKVVVLPAEVAQAIADAMVGQKTRLLRLKSAAKAQGVTLEQRLNLQAKANLASVAMGQMRSAIFDVEDAALLAIESVDASLFINHALMFPAAQRALTAHVSSLKDMQETAGAQELNDARDAWSQLHSEVNGQRLRNARDAVSSVSSEKRSSEQRLADALAMTAKENNVYSGLVAMHGDGLDPSDDVLAILDQASSGFDEADKSKLNALIKESTRQRKGRTYITDEKKLFDLLPEHFGYANYLLRDALLEKAPAEVAKSFANSALTQEQLTAKAAQVELDGRDVVAGVTSSTGVVDVQLVAAGKLLASLTRGRGDIYALAGQDGIESRVKVMATLMGRDKVTQAEAGVTAIRNEFYKRSGVNTQVTPAQAENEFQAWIGSLAVQQQAVAAPDATQVSLPAWYTVIPEKGVAYEAGDETVPGSQRVLSRIAKQALAAISQNQRQMGGHMYAYVLPSTKTEHGAVRLFPLDQKPMAPWNALHPVEGIAVGFKTNDQLVYMLVNSLQDQPVLSNGNPKDLLASLLQPEAVVAVVESNELAGEPEPHAAPQFVASNLNADTYALRLAAQIGMFDVELKAEYEAIAQREQNRIQAKRDRLALARAKMDADTSAWDKSEFAPRIQAMLESLANAGEKGMEMRAVIQAGINMDAKQAKLSEESVAFREKVAQRELATIALNGIRLSVKAQPITTTGLVEVEPDIGKLPAPIVDAAVLRLNELGVKLALLGFVHYHEVDNRAPQDAIDIADQMRGITSAMLLLAPIRERIAKGYKNAKQQKLDRMEDFATEVIGINTRNYPHVGLDALSVVSVAEREAFMHAGVKIYPMEFKGEPKWSVQNEANRTNGKVFGDSIHSAVDDAKREADLQAARVQAQSERDLAHQAVLDATAARKEANKDKSIADRRKDVILNGQTNLPAHAGLGVGSRRLSMQNAVDQGRAVVAKIVHDGAAAMRDLAIMERVRAKGYMLGLSNENIPLVKEGLEAQARIKLDKYEKPDYRVYAGSDTNGTFWNISKTEYDYAQELRNVNIESPAVVDGVPVASVQAVPPSVRDHVLWALTRMNDVKAALAGVQRARGNGHILSQEWKENQATKLVRPNEILDEFRERAKNNGVDAEAFLQELGGVPDFSMFEPVAQAPMVAVETVVSMQAALVNADPFSEASMDLLGKLQVALSAEVTEAIAMGNMPVYATGNGNHVAIHPSAQKPGMYQVSRYAVDGIIGDSQYNTIEDAVRQEGLASYPRLDEVAASLVIGNAIEAEAKFEALKPLESAVTSLAVPAVEDRSEYPLGKTDFDHRFYGSRVRVIPELRGDTAWEGTVMSTLNGGRLISVVRDPRPEDGFEYSSIRISGNRIDVLELRDSEKVIGNQAMTSLDSPVVEVAPVDYVLTDADRIGLGGLGEKFQDNMRAIQILRVLAAEKRHAVGDELGALARYVGWGGLKGVFNPDNKQWNKQHVALRALLTDAEWSAASRSQLDAFYTAPLVAKAMYSAVSRLGFESGRVLEPSVGVGNFFGFMPDDMRKNSNLHGVELDILTSQIVAALYPSAKIAQATGFQDYNVPAGYFDMAVGNVPFGSQAVSDSKGSVFSGWSIHNYFFAKSIEMLRPGGLMPMVISHNFLDKLDPHVRQWIARRAELVSGVRLPNSAFKENANTEVVTDVLIFKRLDYENSLGKQETPDWLDTTDVAIENPKTGETEMFSVNNYFIKNPQNVLGDNSATGSMYRANEYTVLPNGELDVQLAQWVETLPQGIYVPLERSLKEIEAAAVEVPEFVKEGSFFIQGEVVWQRGSDRHGEQHADVWVPPNQRALERMKGMIQIREVLRSQMRLERSVNGDGDIEAGRAELNRVYDAFVKQNGFVNDPVNKRIFTGDTESALVESLEFNYEKALSPAKAVEYGVEQSPSKAVKADIFSQRVLFPPGEIEVVQNAKDALLHSLNFTGGVDMRYMQQAYGKDEQEIIAELGDLLFNDPVVGLVTADEYLSGDVKTKYAEVSKAAERDFSLVRNVEALKQIIPADKLPSEIHASIGAAWIPPQMFAEFAKEISDSTTSFNYVAATGHWLRNASSGATFAKNNDEFGTAKMGALDILTLMMNSRAPEIKKKVMVDGEERQVIDEEQTEAVRHRADKIRSQWDAWLWTDGSRADQLASIYNDKFNRTVERKYDGSHLTFPGMSPAMSLLSHQKNGVWRGLQDRVMLLDQVVGAGKTYEGVAMMMEMRRLGITKKPLIAVPNHLTLQWRTEFYKLYPGANVLAATPKDFEKDNRERFFSKIVTGNWDAIVVGHSSLKKIAVPLEAETKIVSEQFDDIADAIQVLKQARGDRNVIRDMEKIKANLESKLVRLKEKGGKKDDVVDFSELGVDALFIDEMHEFKNLFFTTQMNRVAGLGNPAGSGKAFDLFVKIRWLQDTFGDKAPLIAATGTPISNSLAEMYTMQRYMQYAKLKANDLHIFDSWAKLYGDVQNVYEVAPSGTGYRLSQRFAKFKNLGSLMGEYRSFSDVITLEDLKAQEAALGKVFPVPKLEGGKPQNIVAKRSPLQEKFFGIPEIVRDDNGDITFEINLDKVTTIEKTTDGKFAMQQVGEDDDGVMVTRLSAKRYDTAEEAAYMTALGAVTPIMTIDPNSIVGQFDNLRQLTRATNGKINALSLTGLANKAGLDYRLIDAHAEDFAESKVNIAVGNIVETARKWEADKGVQLVFCDLSVPLSAKAKMASKEKRIYVRDEKGDLTHKKGTMHTEKGLETYPYFLVQEGKGNTKTYTMYDAYTGQLLKEGLDSKASAHTITRNLLANQEGKERWLEWREKSLIIEGDEIDDYKNEHTIDADGDAADLEISREDIEGSTGVAGFSIYDDMKAKLVAQGIPANQIEFIHDHDTPQAKELLFKRVNAGDVRVLFGSTPKMGAGTNVQSRLVALHHIDAPWRPSDLEQREGRIIRRGNLFYERDPNGFRIYVNRYATAQTYDTRRWQLLEHKAAGLEQLRNYAGASEMEDVANEASNSSDMKAAASGNPLILKETQLATEMKKLQMLSRAHRDGDFLKRSHINSNRVFAESFGPTTLSGWETLKMQRDSAGVLAIYGGVKLAEKEQVMAAVDKIHSRLDALGAPQVIIYRGLKFEFSRDEGSSYYKMKTPDDDGRLMDVFSRSGIVTRMDNWCNGIESEITSVTQRIANSFQRIAEMEKLLGKPFEHADELIVATAEHGKVQRALMKSNSMAAVKPEELAAFTVAVEAQKAKLRAFGLGEAVNELEHSDGGEHTPVKARAETPVETTVEPEVQVDREATMSLAAHGDRLVNAMPAGMRPRLTQPSITLKDGKTVSRKEYVDGLLGEGYTVAEYYAAPRGSNVGFVLNSATGKKVPLDSDSLHYADNTIMNSHKAAKPEVASNAVIAIDPVVVGDIADMELYIKVAADSIGDLRKTDVFRVLIESNRAVNRAAIADYIKRERPDLVNEVNDVMDEAHAESIKAESVETADVLKEYPGLSVDARSIVVPAEPALSMAVPLETMSVGVESLGVNRIKARMVSAMPVTFPDNWIVMNAPRPLLGSRTMEGEFLTGRFYAGIDPEDAMAGQFIKANEKLDARIVVAVSRETQMALALHGNEYRTKYMEYEPNERYEMLSGLLDKFRDMPVGELSKAILEAKGVVKEGAFSGPVLSVANGVVTQKINREGATVCHDVTKLSASFAIGDVVDVSYQGGRGIVKGADLEPGVGR